MDSNSAKREAKAQAKAAKAAKKAKDLEESKTMIERLVKAGFLDECHLIKDSATAQPVQAEHGSQKDNKNDAKDDKCDCARSKKKHFLANMGFCFFLFLTFLIIHLATTYSVGGVVAADVGTPEAGHTTQVVARGLDVDSVTPVTDTSCTVTPGSTYPTPSAALPTATFNGVMATGRGPVTPVSSQTVTMGPSCGAAEAVTVTVTEESGADALSGTANIGGSPPQSDTAMSGSIATITTNETVTVTSTATASETTLFPAPGSSSSAEQTSASLSTEQTSSSSSAADTETSTSISTMLTTATSTATSTTTVSETTSQTSTPPNAITTIAYTSTTTAVTTLTGATTTITIHPTGATTPASSPTSFTTSTGPVMGTGTGNIMGTGRGTAGTAASGTFTLRPSANNNNTFTYTVPSATPRTSIIVSSAASVASRGGTTTRGTGGTGGGGGGGILGGVLGVKGGYYCVVMAVACGVVLLVG